MAAFAFPSGSICRVMLVTINDPFVAFEASDCLDATLRIRRIEVCATDRIGEGERGQAVAVLHEVRDETFLLLVSAKPDDRLRSKSCPKKRAGQTRIDDAELFGGERKFQS